MTLTFHDDEDQEEQSCDCFFCDGDTVDGTDYCENHQLLAGLEGGDGDA